MSETRMNRTEMLNIAKPILLNTEMVRAILDNRKTVTRGVIKFPEGTTGRLPERGARDYIFYPGGIKRPPYKVGDILYVRETWAIDEQLPYDNYIYRADDKNPIGWCVGHRWHPSIHMPKEAARIFLRVKSVRVERLCDIDVSNCVREGVTWGNYPVAWTADAKPAFIKLWNSTIKPADLPLYGWNANPWVWVTEFERMEAQS